jgi:hypothetical protein
VTAKKYAVIWKAIETYPLLVWERIVGQCVESDLGYFRRAVDGKSRGHFYSSYANGY